MSTFSYGPGLYVVRRAAHNSPGIWHYAILDIGNNCSIAGVDNPAPKLIHQCPPKLQWCWFEGTGTWEVLAQCPDEIGAIERIAWMTANDPLYNLVGNNCEHFATHAAFGEKRSGQIEIAFLIASIGLVFILTRKG